MKSKLGVSVQMQCTLSGLILNPRRHRGSAFGDLRARPFASGLSSSVAMVGTCPPPRPRSGRVMGIAKIQREKIGWGAGVKVGRH